MSKDQKIVLAAGAFGGLASWAYSVMAGTPLYTDKWSALPLCVILGVAAAFIAVYMITPTDVTQAGRLLGYALLCGIMWKPVIDGATIIMKQKTTVQVATNNTASAATTLANAAAPQIDTRRAETTDAVTKLLQVSDQLANPDAKQAAAQPATQAVNAIAATSSQNPVEARKSLQKIADTAAQTNHTEVRSLALKKLQLIQIPRTMPTAGGRPGSNP